MKVPCYSDDDDYDDGDDNDDDDDDDIDENAVFDVSRLVIL